MATWSNLNFQNSASPLMEELIFFHDHTLLILIMITMMVLYIMLTLLFNNKINKLLLQGQTIEIIWTILPAFILIFIALPSLQILYMLDETFNPLLSIKTIGHQWYWSYEYMDFKNKIEFDSYLIPHQENNINSFRLLDVDNHVVLPMNSQIRILVTAADVIHSWTVPTLGVKIDGSPGRLNQSSFLINRPGKFYGQCSEICGANHSFMPIIVESVNLNNFISWIIKM
uniref:Cytochrome c oxidase subunit 2 n=1 Tax=Ornebius bimaculatus TaxID=2153490 RepID=A0A385I1Y9_9ORTH|nr:cytochrome c oxidase subunit II [Ornebius bimaculatus]AXY63926.1 cytochrome c oxidase subunit 2 [Ornebius bimaculatus]